MFTPSPSPPNTFLQPSLLHIRGWTVLPALHTSNNQKKYSILRSCVSYIKGGKNYELTCDVFKSINTYFRVGFMVICKHRETIYNKQYWSFIFKRELIWKQDLIMFISQHSLPYFYKLTKRNQLAIRFQIMWPVQ